MPFLPCPLDCFLSDVGVGVDLVHESPVLGKLGVSSRDNQIWSQTETEEQNPVMMPDNMKSFKEKYSTID